MAKKCPACNADNKDGALVCEYCGTRLSTDKPRSAGSNGEKRFCTSCGKPYHRVKCANKWIYWYCIGKKRTGADHDPSHHGPNIPDSHLRRISAHMMGAEEFDASSFLSEVERITVQPDGSMEYHFTDGRISQWQKT